MPPLIVEQPCNLQKLSEKPCNPPFQIQNWTKKDRLTEPAEIANDVNRPHCHVQPRPRD